MSNQTSNPIDVVLSLLPDARKNGSGYAARCPAHDDRRNSLSVGEGDDGRALVKCHAGCETLDVVAKIGLKMKDLFPDHGDRKAHVVRSQTGHSGNGAHRMSGSGKGKHTDYLYQTGSGETLAIKRRIDLPDGKKTFVWFTLEGHKAGKPGLGGMSQSELPLYGLPQLTAAPIDTPVLFVEGEKACEAARSHGFVAVSPNGGAGQTDFGDALNVLQGRTVNLWPDNDDAGVKLMERVGKKLLPVCKLVRVFQPADLKVPEKGDAYDYFKRGGTADALKLIMEQAPPFVSSEEDEQEAKVQPKPPKLSEATALVELALASHCGLWHTPDHRPYINVSFEDHSENWPLRSEKFSRWLSRQYYLEAKKAPSSLAVKDALGVLMGRALYDGPEFPVHIRVAEHNGNIYVDLANPLWQAIEVMPAGWKVIDEPPVKFRRSRGMLPLPIPERGGSLKDLSNFLNPGLDDYEGGWALVAAFLIACMRPTGPFPMLALASEQGSGKTTVGRLLKDLIDPNVAPLRSEPKDARDVMVAASNSWLLAYDNFSHVPNWLSDCLCRLSTGGGFGARELYSDEDEVLFSSVRPILLTSIEDVVARGDLMDRAIVLNLPPLSDHDRKPESQLWAEFHEARPRILGALLDAVSYALRNIDSTHLAELPRMADFALWVSAAEPALGLEEGDFVTAYTDNRAEAANAALETPVAQYLIEHMKERDEWGGTATELLADLKYLAPDATTKQRSWPSNARSLSGHLRRLMPNLRRGADIDVEFVKERVDGKVVRRIRLTKMAESSVNTVPRVNTEREVRHPVDATPAAVDGNKPTGIPVASTVSRPDYAPLASNWARVDAEYAVDANIPSEYPPPDPRLVGKAGYYSKPKPTQREIAEADAEWRGKPPDVASLDLIDTDEEDIPF